MFSGRDHSAAEMQKGKPLFRRRHGNGRAAALDCQALRRAIILSESLAGPIMIELLRTNDIVLISAIEALLREAGVYFFVADQNMSVLEGSLGFLPRRVCVAGGRGATRRGACCGRLALAANCRES